MSTFDKKLGELLKQQRIDSRLSQQDVADRLGVSRSCITYYELGKRSIDIVTLYKLCDIYNTDIVDVFSAVKKYVYKK